MKPVFASTTDGTISSGDVWSEKIGWLNFASTNGNVHVTDTELTGNVWSRLYGWIKLNPTNSGVKNNAEGVLSGNAWGENIGWIDFSGVIINASGLFFGTASGTNTGIVNFSCTNCLVHTDWRPASTRVVGIALPVTISPVASPPVSAAPATSIAPAPLPPVISPISISSSTVIKIIGQVKDVIGTALGKVFPIKTISAPLARLYSEAKLWFPYWFKAPPVEKIPVERFVAKKTPFAFKGKLGYIDPQSVKRFVFAPLPKEFLALETKFPQVRGILRQVGINRMSDLEKLKTAQVYLPGLTRAVSLGQPQIETGQFAKEKNIPLDELSQDLKNKIPSDIIFARAAGQLVDFRIALSLTSKGRAEQKISTVSGKPLQLTLKPDKPAKRIRGFLVFRSRQPQARAEAPLADLINSLFFAEPAFAYNLDQPVSVEEKLVLLEFDYTDPDGDGIYTADIQSPVPAGEYEIITVIDYVDPELGSKQIRLITVVDPEGYVFEKIAGKELRISGAKVAIYYFNIASKTYEQWPAKDFQQDNPQITGLSGSYSFLVPGGMYYITAEAKGYAPYQGEPFQVSEGDGVHTNIELQARYGWLKILDWKTAVLILVSMLLLWNFYKDRRREKCAPANINNK